MVKTKPSQGRRRSLLDEMEHDESSRRHSEQDDFGVPQRFDQVFIGGDGDDDYDDYDEEDDLLLMRDRRHHHHHHQHSPSIDDGDESSSTGVYSPLEPTQRRISSSSNDLGVSTGSDNPLALDPLYEGSDEMVTGGGGGSGSESFLDMEYEDPDAPTSSSRRNSKQKQQAPHSRRRSFNDRSSSASASVNVSDLSSSADFGPPPRSPRSARTNLLLPTRTEVSSRRVGHTTSNSSLAADTRGSSVSGTTSVAGSRNLFKNAMRKRATFLHSRTSMRDAGGTTTSGSSHITDAVSRLHSHPSGDFEHVAAAAAVVAASTQAPVKRGVQFSRGDFALVVLTLLGMTDTEGEKDKYTVDPVNAHGYPQGQGKTESQRHGPYLYVLCQVTQVHFDEDERYYTVRRCDNNKEQRADQAFMEAIRDEDAVEVALRAAKRTEREPKLTGRDEHGYIGRRRCSEWYKHWVEELLVPWYRQKRKSAKTIVKHMMDGDHGYAINLSFSSINLLVSCSFIFLFLDVVTISFLSVEWDQAAAVVGLVVWSVLVVELLFEFLIRPNNYYELVTSDKAFAPTTARHINRYHLICEFLALFLYIPEVSCTVSESCPSMKYFGTQAALLAMTSESHWEAALGRFLLGLTFLRAFGLVRHWKQMWINHTFDKKDSQQTSVVRRLLLVEGHKTTLRRMMMRRRKKTDGENDSSNGEDEDLEQMGIEAKIDTEEDKQLKSAANIGTALMVVNSHRALFFMLLIVVCVPVLLSGLRNPVSYNEVRLLQANNVASNTTDLCEYLENAVQAWFKSTSLARQNFYRSNADFVVRWVQLLPVRCDWQNADGVIHYCGIVANGSLYFHGDCDVLHGALAESPEDAEPEHFAEGLGLRPGGVHEIEVQETGPADFQNGMATAEFYVRAIFNESDTIANTYFSLFLLMTAMLVVVLIGLTVMRSDAQRLVLFPLQRMLMIVVHYAENPLSTPTSNNHIGRKGSHGHKRGGEPSGGTESEEEEEEQLGHYETEQLINAIAKIADLLRKCWGVAGAGIISSNLARTKDGKTVVFNPTIPGKQVYALFGFIGINDFSKQLRALEGDVMILINDVARVVHDEVYRWAMGDSGQCNKNLGSAFLMVFRIGDFSEVHDRKKRATDVVFNSELKNVKVKQRQAVPTRKKGRRASYEKGTGDTLQLASLPGIQAFADRALLGCLKSFAGLHRDQNLKNWQKDFRLGAGVGNFTINAIYGFDAGWAVEGAVGSEYKIDATYLSPHVNMASRMMSACKQYGVKVLLSQAVEELLSKPARSKLRHLDTVYVKGSAVDQRIYTYDARHEGVDFFLFERSPEQADIEAESYTPAIWDTDQDLKSMRQHVTDEFQKKYHEGLQQYLEGSWKTAIRLLQEADNMMFEEVVEAGFVDYMSEDLREYGRATTKTSQDELARLKNEFGDGACKCLINFMQRRDAIPPPDWHGVRHLMSK